VETLTAQGVLTALALGALVWTFVVAPRRATEVAAPAPASPAPEAHAVADLTPKAG
jgi:hypothetical protein